MKKRAIDRCQVRETEMIIFNFCSFLIIWLIPDETKKPQSRFNKFINQIMLLIVLHLGINRKQLNFKWRE